MFKARSKYQDHLKKLGIQKKFDRVWAIFGRILVASTFAE